MTDILQSAVFGSSPGPGVPAESPTATVTVPRTSLEKLKAYIEKWAEADTPLMRADQLTLQRLIHDLHQMNTIAGGL